MQRVLENRGGRPTVRRTLRAALLGPLLAACFVQSSDAAADPARERLGALLADPTTPDRPDDLDTLLRAPDRRTRALAARVAARRPHPDDVAALGPLLALATPGELRAVVEAAAAPLPDAWGALAADLYRDGGRERAPFAIEWAAALSPAEAESVLLSFLDVPARDDLVGKVLTALGAVATERSVGRLLELARDPRAGVAAAAGRALSGVRTRLLAEARAAEALDVARRVREHAPLDLDPLLQEALIEGVYLERPDPVLRRLDRRFRDLESREPGALAREAAEIALASAVVAWLAGDPGAAGRWIDRALERIGRPPPHQRSAATTRARILLVASIVELRSRGRTAAVDARIRRAEAAASLEETYCRFDDALDGPFGARTILSHLRRRGEEETRLLWLAAADEALAETSIGIPLDAEDAPAAGTDEAAVASERIRSWLPCRRAWAEFEAGRLETAAAVARRVESVLGRSELWNNRLLAAECSLVLGHAEARDGDAAGAREAYGRAARTFEELGEEGLRYEIEEERGRFLEGEAPRRPHHAERRAQALLGLGEVAARLEDDEAGGEASMRRAQGIAPDVLNVRLAFARTLAAGEDVERATRLLDGTPRRAGLVLELAELARALGRTDEARTLFERHLLWNALSAERADVERRWFARLRDGPRDG
ncbi:MAG: hypothetical protein ACF8XB_19095 [Planctomycetota bacterium JB042]